MVFSKYLIWVLDNRFNISEELENQINNLSISQIESLADAIFDFQSLSSVQVLLVTG